MSEVILLLGGNLGDRYAYLQQAIVAIRDQIGEILQASSVYETACWGNDDQPDYLNQALRVSTSLSAEEVLNQALDIERQLGRVRTRIWEPRVIDIDLIFYDDLIYQSARLTLPHPRIAVRRFVLAPLCELIPHYVHPVYQQTVHMLLQQCSDTSAVTRLSLPPIQNYPKLHTEASAR
ncbi:MAG: 2-amino-4-hydroxy-6-hydroxymethyldihydropteridine diphosphokinase [Thermoflavifilum sp.]|nr:2-amino-4-hydroxy-6-hydroxymethyldihydropteridine diphosphokinase [Thermoflavifilum sp.]